jgi:hypothetical protein
VFCFCYEEGRRSGEEICEGGVLNI